jgi:ABC-type sulfate/molybdate transport systems ATPase subunit
MLEINVTRRLRDFGLEADIKVRPGENLVIMGENGSGKTTVLNMVAGLLMPDTGYIRLGDVCLFDKAARLNWPPEARNVGYLFQSYALFPHMSVYDNVAFGLRMRKMPRAEIDPRIRQLLESMDMWDLRIERAVKLSGGQKQRVALARALAIDPAIFLLDEPLSAIDAETQSSLRKELRQIVINSGVPCITVTHSIKDARELADRVCLMEKGKVVVSGTPGEVLRKGSCRFIDSLIDAY